MSHVFLLSDNLLRCQVDHFHTRLARLCEFCAQYLTKTCMWFMSTCHQPNQATQIYVRRKVDVLFVCIFMYMSRIPSQFGFSAVARSALFISTNARLLTFHDYNWGGVGGQRPEDFTAARRRCSLCLKAKKRGPIIKDSAILSFFREKINFRKEETNILGLHCHAIKNKNANHSIQND